MPQPVGIVAEVVKIFLRQIDPATSGVLAEIAQDIRELKRDAGLFGETDRIGPLKTPDMDARQSIFRGKTCLNNCGFGEGLSK